RNVSRPTGGPRATAGGTDRRPPQSRARPQPGGGTSRPTGRAWTRTREPNGARRRTRAPSAAELADVAYAQGHAGPVAPVEEGDRELAARADQVAEDGGRDLAVRAAVRLDDGLCLVGRGAGVIEVGRDARHLPLGLEHP